MRKVFFHFCLSVKTISKKKGTYRFCLFIVIKKQLKINEIRGRVYCVFMVGNGDYKNSEKGPWQIFFAMGLLRT